MHGKEANPELSVIRSDLMPLEKRPPGGVSEGVNSPPCARGSVRYGARFHIFHIHLPTFLWQLRCFVERIIRKRLSDSFIHNSAIVKYQKQLVSHHGQRLCQTLLQQFGLLL